ncbi:MAG: 6-carboxytetrahydropterin synthase [Planctomycetota bacterium]|nr:6-carboxytetrahydropterin synthase [Planctomycetota bacterium]
MFELTLTTEFAAAHAIRMGGSREPLHGHNWRVEAVIAGPDLDGDGLLVDFHLVEETLREIVAPFHNRNLNEVSPFDDVNPTAELVAKHIADRLAERLEGAAEHGVRVARVSVTEAPGCRAAYFPPPPAG